jgi:hypothetical protein
MNVDARFNPIASGPNAFWSLSQLHLESDDSYTGHDRILHAEWRYIGKSINNIILLLSGLCYTARDSNRTGSFAQHSSTGCSNLPLH